MKCPIFLALTPATLTVAENKRQPGTPTLKNRAVPAVSNCGRAETNPKGKGPHRFYSNYYYGTGRRTDPNTYPGQSDYPQYPPRTTTFPGHYDDCQAVNACALAAVGNSGTTWYFSYDLHYQISTRTWICLQYHQNVEYPTEPLEEFSVVDSNVGPCYGYGEGDCPACSQTPVTKL